MTKTLLLLAVRPTMSDDLTELARAAIAHEQFPKDVEDTPKNRQLFASLQQDVANTPKDVELDVPWDWNEEDPEGDTVRNADKSTLSGQAGSSLLFAAGTTGIADRRTDATGYA
jgi:hypothetical protein